MRKRWCVVFSMVLFVGMMLSLVSGANAVERVVERILKGEMLDAGVEIYGFAEQWEKSPSDNTIMYTLRDDWGDKIRVVSRRDFPTNNLRYRVVGIVSYNPIKQKFHVAEAERSVSPIDGGGNITPPEIEKKKLPDDTQPPNPLLLVVLAFLVLILVALIVVFLNSRKKTTGFTASAQPASPTNMQNVTVHTEKVGDKFSVAADPSGTLKKLPFEFEVKDGLDKKTIRVVMPPGMTDNIEYTIGRNEGADKWRHIRIDDITVSSSQAKLTFRSGTLSIQNIADPVQKNATVVNGAKMGVFENRDLKEGDVIQFGSVTLVVKKG